MRKGKIAIEVNKEKKIVSGDKGRVNKVKTLDSSELLLQEKVVI